MIFLALSKLHVGIVFVARIPRQIGLVVQCFLDKIDNIVDGEQLFGGHIIDVDVKLVLDGHHHLHLVERIEPEIIEQMCLQLQLNKQRTGS